MKVVINDCYGGFSLSTRGEAAYLKRKGETPFFYVNARTIDAHGSRIDFDRLKRWEPAEDEGFVIVYTYLDDLGDDPDKEKREGARYFSGRDLNRSDPDLVAVVEEIGKPASGRHANLKVVEVPDDVEWVVEEYDGMEWVSETHRTWR